MPTMTPTRAAPIHTRLFRKGRDQAVRLPKSCRLSGTDVVIYREGNRVIVESQSTTWSPALVAMLTTSKPLDLRRPPRGRKNTIEPLW